jgi:hypothetical protein
MEVSKATLNRRKFCSNLSDKIEQLMDTLVGTYQKNFSWKNIGWYFAGEFVGR